MKFRLWHPMRDQHHATFRFVRILETAERELSAEKLFILDMYLLFPSLLHKCSMTSDMKERFRSLRILKPEHLFLSLPSSQTIYRELRPYQRSAALRLMAMGAFDRDRFLAGAISYNRQKVPNEITQAAKGINLEDSDNVSFLVNDFGALDLLGVKGLLHSTNLPHRIF